MKIWQVLFITYSAYCFLYFLSILLLGISGETFFSLFIFLGHLIGVFSLYLFYRKERPEFNKVVRISIAVFYSIFFIINSGIFLIILFTNPGSFFDAMPISFIDLLPFPLSIIAVYAVLKVFINFKFEKGNLRKYYWYIYFWITAVFFSLGLIAFLVEITKWTFYDYLTVLTIPLSLIPLYSFTYKHKIFFTRFWKVYFWISIVWTAFEMSYSFGPVREIIPLPDYLRSHNQQITPIWVWTILLPLFIPYYYAFYKIAFDKNFFKKN